MSKKVITIAVTCGAILCGWILLDPDTDNGQKIPDNPPVNASTEAERVNYFALHGWEVEEISSKDITIPTNFSEEYEKYAMLQDKQGMPLREYVGKSGKIYVYQVKNYCPADNQMLAELLVCNDTAIASLVYSDNGDGQTLSVG